MIMNTGSMMLHCGAVPQSYEQLKALNASHYKPMTPTHKPMAHSIMRDYVVEGLQRLGKYEVVREQIGISHKGKRCFGLLELKEKNARMYEDYCLIYAWRNANDMAFKAKVGTGSKVFVCDNMALIAEYEIGAKHTLNVSSNLTGRLDKLNETLEAQGKLMHSKYARYKNATVEGRIADHLIMEAVRKKALPKTKIDKVDQEWNNPTYHYEGRPWSAWHLFNAFTHVNKGLNYADQISRTQRLHKVFDNYLELG
jgi:hypothetical protein